MTKEYALGYETSVIAIAPDDSSLFVGDKKGVVHAIDIESGNETHSFEMWGTRITAITVAATKKWLLVGDTTGKIKLFDYETKTVRIIISFLGNIW
jgi:WD40 repeat protein